MARSGALSGRRPRLAAVTILLAAGLVLVRTLLGSAGWTFQVPRAGLHRQLDGPCAAHDVVEPRAAALRRTPFAGRPGGEACSGEAAHAAWEPSPLLIAATALAATSAASQFMPVGDENTEKTEEKTALQKAIETLRLPVYVGLWYFFNVQYNLQNKRLLKVFTATWAVSWFQIAAGLPIAGLIWTLGFVKPPKVTMDDMLKLAPVGAAFAGGQVATVASLGSVAVSFTHVVKALEPAVNAVGSALVLGQVFHPMVYLSLAPVFIGVALASSSELSFTMFGFLTAMASNFFFVTRNVLATKLGSVGDMGTDKTERKTNQLAVLTFVAALVLFPIALFIPGGLLSAPDAWNAAIAKGVPPKKLLYLLATSGFHFFMYQLSSFWVLSQVPPITHSVLNTLKRVVIIVVSIIVFRTPVTTKSAIGTATAIGGVLLYSITKRHYSKKAKAKVVVA